jgi:hypothetical protein
MRDLQYVLDYIEIRDLAARYNRFADLADGENYAALFTLDGEFEIVGNRTYRGRDEIASACNATQVTVHITCDPLIEIDGDRATQRSRLLAFFLATDGSANEFVSTGWYVDELVRTPDGWRFRRRRAQTDLRLDAVHERMSITAAFAALKQDAL